MAAAGAPAATAVPAAPVVAVDNAMEKVKKQVDKMLKEIEDGLNVVDKYVRCNGNGLRRAVCFFPQGVCCCDDTG